MSPSAAPHRPGEPLRLTVDGHERTGILLTPAGGRRAAPLVILLHGSNQTAAVLRRFAGGTFDRLVDGGAVVAYLDGYRKNWNDARRGSRFAARRDGIDDVAFARAVIDLLAASDGIDQDGIDRARVFVAGYSAGGAMVIRLVHEVPQLLAGAAIMSATQPVPENFLLTDARPYPLPIMLVHGTKDPLVPYEGGMASLWGFRARGLGVSAADTAAYFAARNGITARAVVTARPAGTGARTSVGVTEYREDGRAPVTLLTVVGGGHVVPNPVRAPWILGPSTDQLVAADEIAAFWDLPVSS